MATGRVKIRYYTTSGRQETIKLETRTKYLDLSNRKIVSIDLSPLQYCSGIRRIDLNGNSLGMQTQPETGTKDIEDERTKMETHLSGA
ncbi:MAG: hypothetical protein P1Q69_06325 [Candidatus Thorarchaeota archaeon]|nr:hypothetical protein [Candidatus Thorarchaeota archaeon]